MTFLPTMAHRKAMAAAFVAAIQEWRANHRQETVASALAVYTLTDKQRRQLAVDSLNFDHLHQQVTTHLGPHISDTYTQAWNTAYSDVSKRWDSAMPNTGTPDPRQLVHDRADVLVDSTWDAVNTVAAMVIAQHLDPWAGAALVLTAAGLNRRQGIAVANQRKALAAIGKPTKDVPATVKPLSDQTIQKRLDAAAKGHLRKRATMVGWYEPGHAAGIGRLEAWRRFGDEAGFDELAEQGLQAVREWVVGANPCDDCGGMAGTQVAITDHFPGGDMPRHPACECHDELTTVAVDQPLGVEGIGWQREHHIDGHLHHPDVPTTAVPDRRAA
jgi:hypothetical protein